MDADEREIRKKSLIIMAIIVLVLLIGGFAYYIYNQEQRISDIAEAFALEKEALSDEYAELSLQYEGHKFSIGNDSLFALLETEQMKVVRLQEELRTVKATNARRINELRKELETLRAIMRNFVVQIDSLNAANQQLRDANAQTTRRLQQASSQVTQLTRETERLTERVTLASRLDAVNIQVKAVNNRSREVKKAKDVNRIDISFQLAKNITAMTGEKNIYIRLMKPDDDILRKPNSGIFSFENREIVYSMMKPVEYDGEEQPIVMYWNVEEFLSEGTYRVDIFADGNRIGRKSFVLEK
jgi:hypothetical protein